MKDVVEWWKPDKFEVVELDSNASLDRTREALIHNNSLRAQYARAKNRETRGDVLQIPLVVRPKSPEDIDGGEVIIIGDVITWPPGTAERILQGELRAATARFILPRRVKRSSYNGKMKKDKPAKACRFRRHSLMQISIQQSETRGERPMMEDRYVIHLFNDIAVFGIFDGHGGTGAADFVADTIVPTLRAVFQQAMGDGRMLAFTNSNPQPPDAIECETVNLLKRSLEITIELVEREALAYLLNKQDFSGTTLCICLCTRRTLIVASLGDSRVYVSRNGASKQVTRKDHSASQNSDEKDRIRKDGGYVNQEGYLGGLVQVSRAIGDLDPVTSSKVVGLSARPDIVEYPLEKDKDEFVLVACDGLWEVLSGQAAINNVRDALKISRGDYLGAADGLVQKALEEHTSDNVTVVIAFLPSASKIWTKPPPSADPRTDDDVGRPRLFLKKPLTVTSSAL